MDSESENEFNCTPPDVLEAASLSTISLLPEKSKKRYEAVYQIFMDWRKAKHVNSFSENVLLAYFGELAVKYKASSLWSHYSILRSTISIKNNVNIEKYMKLRAFLKRKSDGYMPKKAKIFTSDEINQFITTAPNEIHLATKVAVVMGLMGACRANELHSMKIEDFQDLGSAALVTIPNTKTKITRKFTVTDHFYLLCKKYIKLRPNNVSTNSFFLNLQNGKCTSQKIGINKFGAMGKQIALFLKLPNPELYTGHTFRRSSATILVDAGGDLTSLKRHGGWKSSSVAEGYIDDSMKNKMDTAQKIVDSIGCSSSNPRSGNIENNTSTTSKNNNLDLESSSTPCINFSNCTNFTINIVTNK